MDVPTRQALAGNIQRQAFIDVPCIPLGPYFVQTADRGNLTFVLHGSPVF